MWEVVLYLDKLVQNLYQNYYFSFLESAQKYVGDIYDFINETSKFIGAMIVLKIKTFRELLHYFIDETNVLPGMCF